MGHGKNKIKQNKISSVVGKFAYYKKISISLSLLGKNIFFQKSVPANFLY